MRAADFQRALGQRPCARTEHFALHHTGTPQLASDGELSTATDQRIDSPVDDTCRLGLVVPKRMARRAVTRNLVKRQGRAAFDRSIDGLPRGDWLLRLRKPFDAKTFESAKSERLNNAVHAEIGALFASVVSGATPARHGR